MGQQSSRSHVHHRMHGHSLADTNFHQNSPLGTGGNAVHVFFGPVPGPWCFLHNFALKRSHRVIRGENHPEGKYAQIPKEKGRKRIRQRLAELSKVLTFWWISGTSRMCNVQMVVVRVTILTRLSKRKREIVCSEQFMLWL